MNGKSTAKLQKIIEGRMVYDRLINKFACKHGLYGAKPVKPVSKVGGLFKAIACNESFAVAIGFIVVIALSIAYHYILL